MIDRDIPLLGKSMAGKRVARCVFLGTAPSVNKNARSGASGPIGGIEQSAWFSVRRTRVTTQLASPTHSGNSATAPNT
jgi:hypothetical protein